MSKDKFGRPDETDVLSEFFAGVRPLSGTTKAKTAVPASPVRPARPPSGEPRPIAGRPTPVAPGPYSRPGSTVQKELYDDAERRAARAESALVAERARAASLETALSEANAQLAEVRGRVATAAAERDAAKLGQAVAEREREKTRRLNEDIDAHRRALQRELEDLRANLKKAVAAAAVAAPVAESVVAPVEMPAPAVEPDDSTGAIERAMASFTTACLVGGIKRVVFVGGSPAYRKQLGTRCDHRLKFAFVEGNDRGAVPMPSADVVIVWGASELDHVVADKFPGALRVHHRGISGMLLKAAELIRGR